MIYTGRNQLAIIKLQEERTLFSYEELFRALTEHPSVAVYVEWKGLLYGIITLGRIKRAHRNHLERVGINTEFTAITLDETFKAREIFQKERNAENREKRFHVLPVVTAEGKLLGNYTRWDDLLSLEYSLTLLHSLNVTEYLRRELRLAFVRPWTDSPREQRLFCELKKTLNDKGVFAEVIEFSQVLEYSEAVDYILFCRAEECSVAMLLRDCDCLPDCTNRRGVFIDYQHFIKILCDDRSRILSWFQEQGVHVLTFDFEENEAGDLKRFENEIDSRRNRKTKNPEHRLRPEEREGFLLELRDQFEGQELPFSFSARIMPDGGILLRDIDTRRSRTIRERAE